jgi:hypothetical protein
MKNTKPPLNVIVKNHRYNCNGVPTFRNAILMAILGWTGGVSSKVPDGWYEYNVEWRMIYFQASLIPVASD